LRIEQRRDPNPPIGDSPDPASCSGEALMFYVSRLASRSRVILLSVAIGFMGSLGTYQIISA
jgi:hypothetical protein